VVDADSSAPAGISWRAPATIAAVVVMLFGVVVRLLGQTTLELWADEADWAIRAVSGTDTFIRPVGTMWLTRVLVGLHNSEVMLRLPSLLAGIAHLPVLWLVLRRLVRGDVAVLGTLALAVHPVAVAMTKEFKPYALEACLHTLLLLLTLRLLEAPSRARSVVIGALAAVSPLLSWSIVFAYPGTFLAGLITSWRARRFGDAVVLAIGAVVTLVVLALLFMARVQSEDRKADYWGAKYGVFFTGDGVVNHVVWIVNKTAGLAMQPGRLDITSSSFAPVLQGASVVLVVLGVLTLVRRRAWWILVLLTLPLLTTLVFNVARQWPWGVFRTNFYLLPAMILIATIGVDGLLTALSRMHHRARPAVVVVMAIVALACVPHWLTLLARKNGHNQTGQASVHRAMGLLREIETATPTTATPTMTATTKPVLLLDGHACGLFRYYRDHHAAAMAEHRAWFVEHIDERCGTVGNGWFPVVDSMKGRDFWVMVVQRKHEAKTVRRLRAECVVDHERKLPGMTLLHCKAR